VWAGPQVRTSIDAVPHQPLQDADHIDPQSRGFIASFLVAALIERKIPDGKQARRYAEGGGPAGPPLWITVLPAHAWTAGLAQPHWFIAHGDKW
jgi:hypothetical protein